MIKPMDSAPATEERPAGPSTAALEPMAEAVIRPVVREGFQLWWLAGFAVALLLFGLLNLAMAWLFYMGVGIWGLKEPTAWGFAIVSFVWWVGIGHAGTFISAILLLLKQDWRNSVNRLTEAMTLSAVACAGLFPMLHLGRPWIFYWLLPYPNSLDMWPQFRSPLMWDFAAVTAYALFSIMFWYLGLMPDLATMRDRSPHRWQQVIYGVMSLGWRGSIKHWARYQKLYLLLAGIATALVVSVHSIVSLDFAVAIVPGWHSTIFPPYFFAGALFSGFAMVLTLIIPMRYLFGWQQFFTMRHLNHIAMVFLAVELVVAHGYVMETFTAFYSGDLYEMAMMKKRMFGPFASLYWTVIGCNVVLPQGLWFPWVRRCLPLLFVIAILANVGMWLDHYVMVTTSLDEDFLPSAWGMYSGTFWDWATLIGSFGLFLSIFFLLTRLLPAISMHEMGRQLYQESKKKA
jgi:molybdopterin-containing oxidoreductase family membrane subunit